MQREFMNIETYEVEEIKSSEASVMAADAEAMELVNKLGLDGQKKLANPETCTRNPYRKMTAVEFAVFSILFPNHTRIERYDDGIIPLRVLQIAAHCRESELFSGLIVWHPPTGQKDPLLVGQKTNSEHSWMTDNFMLARWGDALESFEALRARAQKIWTGAARSKLMTLRNQIEADIGQLDSIAENAFLTGTVNDPTYQFIVP